MRISYINQTQQNLTKSQPFNHKLGSKKILDTIQLAAITWSLPTWWPFRILERIVKSRPWDWSHPLHEWLNFFHASVWHLDTKLFKHRKWLPSVSCVLYLSGLQLDTYICIYIFWILALHRENHPLATNSWLSLQENISIHWINDLLKQCWGQHINSYWCDTKDHKGVLSNHVSPLRLRIEFMQETKAVSNKNQSLLQNGYFHVLSWIAMSHYVGSRSSLKKVSPGSTWT